MTAPEIGTLLREHRLAQQLTLAQVVEMTDIPSVQYLARLEAGQVNAGRSRHLPALTAALGIPRKQLEMLAGMPPEPDKPPSGSIPGLRLDEVELMTIGSNIVTAPSLLTVVIPDITGPLPDNWLSMAEGKVPVVPYPMFVIDTRVKKNQGGQWDVKPGQHCVVQDRHRHPGRLERGVVSVTPTGEEVMIIGNRIVHLDDLVIHARITHEVVPL